MSNLHFSRLIKAKDRLREFNFRRLPAASGMLFHVDVSDDRSNRIIFKIQKEDGGVWKVLDAVFPAWIVDAEKDLAAAIEDQIATPYQ